MKIVSIVGARPQFIKAAVVSKSLRKHHTEILVHTGQHYDQDMSQVFFDELGLPTPDANLDVRSGHHGWQTGQMLMRIEEVLLDEAPDWVLIYGDTNSTLAGALAAAKLHVKVAHVEAGLRSFNRAMPEEINRVTADHLSDLLLCPSQTAVDNLAAEGIKVGVHLVGDVMADVQKMAQQHTDKRRSDLFQRLGVAEKQYIVATVHRAENTDNEARITQILDAFNTLDTPIIFPVHPRTRKVLERLGFAPAPHLQLIEPVGYLDMVTLTESASLIMTDSGGLQKEAYWLKVPCLTIRDETEWVETIETGWNTLVDASKSHILSSVQNISLERPHPVLYGDGQAADRCAQLIGEN